MALRGGSLINFVRICTWESPICHLFPFCPFIESVSCVLSIILGRSSPMPSTNFPLSVPYAGRSRELIGASDDISP